MKSLITDIRITLTEEFTDDKFEEIKAHAKENNYTISDLTARHIYDIVDSIRNDLDIVQNKDNTKIDIDYNWVLEPNEEE